MGNSDLRSLSTINKIDIGEISNSTAAVDAYNWLYKYVTTTVRFTEDKEYTRDDGVEVPSLYGGIQGIKRFFENDITPVFVFDGGYHDEKKSELEERTRTRQDAKENAEKARSEGNNIEAAKFESRSKTLSDPMIESTKDMLEVFDLPYVVAPQSGESQAAYMVANSQEYDYVVSDDYDSLLFGSPVTIRNFTSSSRPLEKIILQETLENLDITYEQLIDVSILCGTDYNKGISGYGPKTSISAIQEKGGLEKLIESGEIEMEKSSYNTIRKIFIEPTVTKTYPTQIKPPSPDFDNAIEILTEKWELPHSHVNSTINDLETIVGQSGLDRWT